MLVFPSGESKTKATSPPWAGIILAVASLAGYFLLVMPQIDQYERERERTNAAFKDALRQQFEAGHLNEQFWVSSQEDPNMVGDPENFTIFSEAVRRAYHKSRNVPLPLDSMQNGPALQKLALILAPNHWALLVVGIVCLWLTSFLFEHQYDRQFLLATFLLSGCLWIVLDGVVSATYWPPPLFAWSNSIAVLVILGWLTAPRATITLTVKPWPGSNTAFYPLIPAALVPFLYLSALIAVNGYFSPYQSYFSFLNLIPIPMEAALFGLLLMMVSSRQYDEDEDPESLINQQISGTEMLFNEEQFEEGAAVLQNILNAGPTVSQVEKIIHLAWRQDLTGIAHSGYHILLKKAIGSQNYYRILEVIEEMLYRGISVQGPSVIKIFQMSIRRGQIQDARKLLPFIKDHQEVDSETVLQMHEQLLTLLLKQKDPDKRYLLELKEWLEHHHPHSPITGELQAFFQQESQEPQDRDELSRKIAIHRRVPIRITEVNTNRIVVEIKSKVRQIPWTAMLGIHGCYVATDNRGFRGCAILKFQRKVFACHFSSGEIGIPDPKGKPLSFEGLWALFKIYIPEDLPFREMKEFDTLRSEEAYVDMLQDFINENPIYRETA